METSFKFLKDPLFIGPVFLKKPGRVKALAYVLLMALRMFGLLERRVREAMKHESEPRLRQPFKVPKVLKLAGFSPDIYLNVKERNEYLS